MERTRPPNAEPPSIPPRAGGGIDATFAVQLAVAGLASTAVNAVRPMMTYRALGLGASAVEVGLIAAAFSIVPAVLAVAIGRSVDRIGEARFIMVALVLMTAGGVMAATVGSLVLLALSQMLIGLGHVTNLVAGQALVGNRGGGERREHRYGLYSTMGSFGHLAGPLLAAAVVSGSTLSVPPIDDPTNAQSPAFLLAAAVAGAAFALAFLLPRRHAGIGADRRAAVVEIRPGALSAAWHVLRRPGMPFAMLVSVIVVSSIDVLIAYLPLYGEARGLSVEAVGLLLAIRAAGSIVSRLLMGIAIDRMGRSAVLIGSLVIASAGLVVLPLSGSPVVLGAAMGLVGLGLGVGQPITMAWVANRSPRAERATALGVRLTGNRTALVVVPIAVGAVAGAAGVSVIFWLLAALLAAGAVASLATPLQPSDRSVLPAPDSS